MAACLRGPLAPPAILLFLSCALLLLATSQAQQGFEEEPPKRKKKRGMSLISNVLEDMGLDDNQKMMVCMVLMAIIGYMRLSRGSEYKDVDHRRPRLYSVCCAATQSGS